MAPPSKIKKPTGGPFGPPATPPRELEGPLMPNGAFNIPKASTLRPPPPVDFTALAQASRAEEVANPIMGSTVGGGWRADAPVTPFAASDDPAAAEAWRRRGLTERERVAEDAGRSRDRRLGLPAGPGDLDMSTEAVLSRARAEHSTPIAPNAKPTLPTGETELSTGAGSTETSGIPPATNPGEKPKNVGVVHDDNRASHAKAEEAVGETVAAEAQSFLSAPPTDRQSAVERLRAMSDQIPSSPQRKKVDALLAKFESMMNGPNLSEDKRSKLFKIMTEVVPYAILAGLGRMDVIEMLEGMKQAKLAAAQGDRDTKMRSLLGLAKIHEGQAATDEASTRALLEQIMRDDRFQDEQSGIASRHAAGLRSAEGIAGARDRTTRAGHDLKRREVNAYEQARIDKMIDDEVSGRLEIWMESERNRLSMEAARGGGGQMAPSPADVVKKRAELRKAVQGERGAGGQQHGAKSGRRAAVPVWDR